MNTANPNRLSYVGSRDAQKKSEAQLLRDSDAWFTPDIYLAAVHTTIGGIGLDPFSSKEANAHVKADRILTMEDDAFTCAWPETHSVFMNPPYGRKLIDRAVARFLREYEKRTFDRAIVLVNNATETQWFKALLRTSLRHCLVDHRIAFTNVDGKRTSGNTRGQVFFLFVADEREHTELVGRFIEKFGRHGTICRVEV